VGTGGGGAVQQRLPGRSL